MHRKKKTKKPATTPKLEKEVGVVKSESGPAEVVDLALTSSSDDDAPISSMVPAAVRKVSKSTSGRSRSGGNDSATYASRPVRAIAAAQYADVPGPKPPSAIDLGSKFPCLPFC